MNNGAVLAVLPTLALTLALPCSAAALVDIARTDEGRIRRLNRPTWLAIVVFGSVIGCLAWLATGRPRDD